MKKFVGLLAAMAMICTFAGSAAAANDWAMYGSARMATFWNDIDNPAPAQDDEDLQWDMQGNSRFGAKVKAGDVKGQLEVGLVQNGADTYGRVLIGEWDFGPGDLLVGQDYTPVNVFYSGQIGRTDNSMIDTGDPFNGRRPMIQLTFGGFKFAAVNVHSESDLGTGGDVDVSLPKFEAKYSYKSNTWYADVFGGFQTYNIERAAGDIDVNAYVFGAGAGMFFGPVEVAAIGWLGQNAGTGGYGLFTASDSAPRINAAGNDVNDNDTWAALALVRYKVTDKVRLEVGYGMIQSELDETTAATSNEDDAQQYYLSCMMTLAKGVYLIPEIGVIDLKENFANAEQPSTMYIGAKWQIDF